jgi:hypothetical protein
MNMPSFQPQVIRARGESLRGTSAYEGAISPQGCNALEWLKCGAIVATCTGLSGPALIACVAAAAPECLKCVS